MIDLSISCFDYDYNKLDRLYQWDLNQVIRISGLEDFDVPVFHFCNQNSEKALVVIPEVIDGYVVADIPNILLNESLPLIIYLYDNNGDDFDGFRTIHRITIPVTPRPKPDTYEYTNNVTPITYELLNARINSLIKQLTDNTPDNVLSAEIRDARIGYNGEQFATLGEHVRQIGQDLSDSMVILEDYVNSRMPDGLLYESNILYLTSQGEIVGDGVEVISGSGGGGGGGGGNEFIITLQNLLPERFFNVIQGAEANISFLYESKNEDEMDDGNGIAKIYVNSIQATTVSITQGVNTINVSRFLSVGNNSIRIRVENSEGTAKSISYNVTVESLNIMTTFDEMAIYSGDVEFSYTVIGSGEKIVHFLMDGIEIGTEIVSTTGRSRTFTISAKPHGAHTFECYATKTINDDVEIRTKSIVLSMLWVQPNNTTPIIATKCNTTSVVQGDTVSIDYLVYNPSTESANVTLAIIDAYGNTYSTQQLTNINRTPRTWTTDDYPSGNIIFQIISGTTTASVLVEAEEYILPVDVVTDQLELEFTAAGRSNAEENPAQWSYNDYEATFSGFGWTDADGWIDDPTEGTSLRFLPDDYMTIPAYMFATDVRNTGYTIEAEFATRDVRDYDTVVVDCTNNGRGFEIKTQAATIKSEQTSVSMQFKEDSRVRVTFVVEQRNLNRFVYIYINGVMCGIRQYPALDNFAQATPAQLTIGADSCGLDLYRIRWYKKGLTRREQLDNFIADRPTLADRQLAVQRNDILNSAEEMTISKLPFDLPYMVITGTTLPTDKKAEDIKNCTVNYVDRANPSKNFTATGVNMSVQGTSSAGYPVKNFKIKLFKSADSTLTINGTPNTKGYTIYDGDVPVKTFCLKADYASSEGANNVELVELYNKCCPYKTPPQIENPAVRQGVAGKPMVLFFNNINDNTTTFVGKYNFNNDKSTSATYGFDYNKYPDAQSWEFLDNSVDLCLFKTDDMSNWTNAFEAREPDGGTDITALSRVVSWVASTRRDTATEELLDEPVIINGQTYTNDTAEYRLAKFKDEFEDYFEKDSALFYYLFTEVFLMVDSRAKNMFLTTFDGEHWCFLPYDMDTAIGMKYAC